MKKLLSIFLSVSMLVAVCLISTVTAIAVESDSKTSTVPVALSDELQTLENEAYVMFVQAGNILSTLGVSVY